MEHTHCDTDLIYEVSIDILVLKLIGELTYM